MEDRRVTPDGAAPGLTDAVRRGVLRNRGDHGRALPYAPTRFDTELLGAVDAAVASRTPIAVALPFAGTAAPILLGAAAVAGAILRTNSLRVEIGVVSSRLTSRVLYDHLCFNDQRISDFIPRTWTDPNGRAHVVGRPNHDSGGRLHLVNTVERLGSLRHALDGVVVDSSAVTPEDVGRLTADLGGRVPMVYLTADPQDPGVRAIRRAGGVVWGWDRASLEELAVPDTPPRSADAGYLLVDPAMLTAAARGVAEVWTPEGSDDGTADALAGQLRDDLIALTRAAGPGPDRYGLRWAWAVSNLLSQLPITPQVYDEHLGSNPFAIRLTRAPSVARDYARNAVGPFRDRWYSLADTLQAVLAGHSWALRFELIQRWLDEAVNAGVSSVLAAANPAVALAITVALDESPDTSPDWKHHIDVLALREIRADRRPIVSASNLCLPGPLPRAHRWMLAAPPAERMVVIAIGSAEAAQVLAQRSTAQAATRALREETANLSAVALGVRKPAASPPPGVADKVTLIGTEIARDAGARSAGPDGEPWEPLDLDLADLLQRSIIPGGPDPLRRTALAARASVPAMLLHFRVPDDDSALLVEPNALLVRRRGASVRRVAAKSVVPGDVILLIDRAARRDLLESVSDSLSESAEYAPLAHLIAFWHARAGRLRNGTLTYAEVLRRMHGTSITTEQAVGMWIRGEVDGPLDPEDIKRFALAVGDNRLAEEADRIGWAVKTLHRVRRKIGTWLSAQISGARLRPEDTLIDADLGIRVADLLESVSSYEVDAVEPGPFQVPPDTVGVVLPARNVAPLQAQPRR